MSTELTEVDKVYVSLLCSYALSLESPIAPTRIGLSREVLKEIKK
jgi:hypothetical protein